MVSINQLERVLEQIARIFQTLQEDSEGTIYLHNKLGEFKEEVDKDLKELVWEQYKGREA